MSARRRLIAGLVVLAGVGVSGGYAVAQTEESSSDAGAWDNARVVELDCATLGPDTLARNPNLERCFRIENAPPISPEDPISPYERQLMCDAAGPQYAEHVLCNPPAPPPGAPEDEVRAYEQYQALQGE